MKILGQFLLNFMFRFKVGIGCGGGKVYLNGPGHMTKMASTSICGINLKRSRYFAPLPLG